MKYIPQLTFDTSCIVSLLGRDNTPDDELAALNLIVEWARNGKVNIWTSPKSATESIGQLKNSTEDIERQEVWKDTLVLLNKFTSRGGLFILDVSRLDEDVLGYEDDALFFEDLKRLVHPHTLPSNIGRGHIFDLSIFADHRHFGNDLFVTRDGRFLKPHIASELSDRWGIIVCSPVDAIGNIKQLWADTKF